MYKTPYILINDNGIDLLRNGFVYQHIDYFEIKDYKVKDGYLLQNRWIAWIFGFLLIMIALIILINQIPIYRDFILIIHHNSTKGLGFVLLTPLAFMIFSVILFWQSFIKSKILQISTDVKVYNIRIKEIEKSGELKKMIDFFDFKVLKR